MASCRSGYASESQKRRADKAFTEYTKAEGLEQTIPVLPNVFPYNEMLLGGILRIGEYGVKTRSWSWKHRGPVLLYTSTSTHMIPAKAYGFDPKLFPRRVIVGVGNLVDVRDLTEKEQFQLLCQFNNVTPSTARRKKLGRSDALEDYIDPCAIGFFFKDLRRFKQPVPFKWPQGAVSVFRAPVTLVAEELRRLGVAIR